MPKYSFNEYISNKDPGKKVRTVSLVLTQDCNLKCTYCYENHSQRKKEIMTFEVAKETLMNYLHADDEFDWVLIDLFGGEPLMAFPVIKKIFEWITGNTWKKRYHFLLGTNGTLFNDEMKSFFAENREYFSVSMSLDGNRIAHNLNRNNSYDLISPHLDFIKTNWPTQSFKMTVSAETIPYVADSVIELEKMELFFSANIVFEDMWGEPENKQRLLNEYEKQLDRLVDFYIDNPLLYPVYPMLGLFPSYLGIPGFQSADENDCVRFCGAGHEMLVVDTDGTIYPCHRFLPLATNKPAPNKEINRQNQWKPDECADCKIVHSCPTCAGFNWQENNDTGIRSTYHCEAHKLEVLAAVEIAAHRIGNIPKEQFDAIPEQGRSELKHRIDAVMDIYKNGI